MTTEQEQQIIEDYTPEAADMILEYEGATAKRQVEIISYLRKNFILDQLGGLYQAAFQQLKSNNWLNEAGDIITDLNSVEWSI